MSYSSEHYQKNKLIIQARNRIYRERNPWYDCWRNAHARCEDPRNKNYAALSARGIKCTLTKEDVIFMWKRDLAPFMLRPSIDRLDANKNYELSNCRIIELIDNVARRHNPEHMPAYPSCRCVTMWVD